MENYGMNAMPMNQLPQSQSAGAALQGSYGQQTQAQQQTAMGMILQKLEQRINAIGCNNGRLDSMRIRLQGERPANEAGTKAPIPSGVLGQIHDRLNTLSMIINAQGGIIADLEKYV